MKEGAEMMKAPKLAEVTEIQQNSESLPKKATPDFLGNQSLVLRSKDYIFSWSLGLLHPANSEITKL